MCVHISALAVLDVQIRHSIHCWALKSRSVQISRNEDQKLTEQSQMCQYLHKHSGENHV